MPSGQFMAPSRPRERKGPVFTGDDLKYFQSLSTNDQLRAIGFNPHLSADERKELYDADQKQKAVNNYLNSFRDFYNTDAGKRAQDTMRLYGHGYPGQDRSKTHGQHLNALAAWRKQYKTPRHVPPEHRGTFDQAWRASLTTPNVVKGPGPQGVYADPEIYEPRDEWAQFNWDADNWDQLTDLEWNHRENAGRLLAGQIQKTRDEQGSLAWIAEHPGLDDGTKTALLVNEAYEKHQAIKRNSTLRLGRDSDAYLEKLPFSWYSVTLLNEVNAASKRIADGTADGNDWLMVTDYLGRMQSDGETLMAQSDEAWDRFEKGDYGVAIDGMVDVVTQLPGFMFEFWATGPLYAIGRKGGKAAMKKALKGRMKKLLFKNMQTRLYSKAPALGKSVLRGIRYGTNQVALGVPGAVLQAGVGMPHMWARTTFQHMMPELRFNETEAGEFDAYMEYENAQSFPQALVNGLLDATVEVGSERMGFPIERGMGKIRKAMMKRIMGSPNGQALFKMRLLRHWLRGKAGRTVGGFRRALAQGGYDGVLGEVFEERMGELMRNGVHQFTAGQYGEEAAGAFKAFLDSDKSLSEKSKRAALYLAMETVSFAFLPTAGATGKYTVGAKGAIQRTLADMKRFKELGGSGLLGSETRPQPGQDYGMQRREEQRVADMIERDKVLKEYQDTVEKKGGAAGEIQMIGLALARLENALRHLPRTETKEVGSTQVPVRGQTMAATEHMTEDELKVLASAREVLSNELRKMFDSNNREALERFVATEGPVSRRQYRDTFPGRVPAAPIRTQVRDLAKTVLADYLTASEHLPPDAQSLISDAELPVNKRRPLPRPTRHTTQQLRKLADTLQEKAPKVFKTREQAAKAAEAAAGAIESGVDSPEELALAIIEDERVRAAESPAPASREEARQQDMATRHLNERHPQWTDRQAAAAAIAEVAQQQAVPVVGPKFTYFEAEATTTTEAPSLAQPSLPELPDDAYEQAIEIFRQQMKAKGRAIPKAFTQEQMDRIVRTVGVIVGRGRAYTREKGDVQGLVTALKKFPVRVEVQPDGRSVRIYPAGAGGTHGKWVTVKFEEVVQMDEVTYRKLPVVTQGVLEGSGGVPGVTIETDTTPANPLGVYILLNARSATDLEVIEEVFHMTMRLGMWTGDEWRSLVRKYYSRANMQRANRYSKDQMDAFEAMGPEKIPLADMEEIVIAGLRTDIQDNVNNEHWHKARTQFKRFLVGILGTMGFKAAKGLKVEDAMLSTSFWLRSTGRMQVRMGERREVRYKYATPADYGGQQTIDTITEAAEKIADSYGGVDLNDLYWEAKKLDPGITKEKYKEAIEVMRVAGTLNDPNLDRLLPSPNKLYLPGPNSQNYSYAVHPEATDLRDHAYRDISRPADMWYVQTVTLLEKWLDSGVTIPARRLLPRLLNKNVTEAEIYFLQLYRYLDLYHPRQIHEAQHYDYRIEGGERTDFDPKIAEGHRKHTGNIDLAHLLNWVKAAAPEVYIDAARARPSVPAVLEYLTEALFTPSVVEELTKHRRGGTAQQVFDQVIMPKLHHEALSQNMEMDDLHFDLSKEADDPTRIINALETSPDALVNALYSDYEKNFIGWDKFDDADKLDFHARAIQYLRARFEVGAHGEYERPVAGGMHETIPTTVGKYVEIQLMVKTDPKKHSPRPAPGEIAPGDYGPELGAVENFGLSTIGSVKAHAPGRPFERNRRGYLGHVRGAIQKDSDGRKVFMIQTLQSDPLTYGNPAFDMYYRLIDMFEHDFGFPVNASKVMALMIIFEGVLESADQYMQHGPYAQNGTSHWTAVLAAGNQSHMVDQIEDHPIFQEAQRMHSALLEEAIQGNAFTVSDKLRQWMQPHDEPQEQTKPAGGGAYGLPATVPRLPFSRSYSSMLIHALIQWATENRINHIVWLDGQTQHKLWTMPQDKGGAPGPGLAAYYDEELERHVRKTTKKLNDEQAVPIDEYKLTIVDPIETLRNVQLVGNTETITIEKMRQKIIELKQWVIDGDFDEKVPWVVIDNTSIEEMVLKTKGDAIAAQAERAARGHDVVVYPMPVTLIHALVKSGEALDPDYKRPDNLTQEEWNNLSNLQKIVTILYMTARAQEGGTQIHRSFAEALFDAKFVYEYMDVTLKGFKIPKGMKKASHEQEALPYRYAMPAGPPASRYVYNASRKAMTTIMHPHQVPKTKEEAMDLLDLDIDLDGTIALSRILYELTHWPKQSFKGPDGQYHTKAAYELAWDTYRQAVADFVASLVYSPLNTPEQGLQMLAEEDMTPEEIDAIEDKMHDQIEQLSENENIKTLEKAFPGGVKHSDILGPLRTMYKVWTSVFPTKSRENFVEIVKLLLDEFSWFKVDNPELQQWWDNNKPLSDEYLPIGHIFVEDNSPGYMKGGFNTPVVVYNLEAEENVDDFLFFSPENAAEFDEPQGKGFPTLLAAQPYIRELIKKGQKFHVDRVIDQEADATQEPIYEEYWYRKDKSGHDGHLGHIYKVPSKANPEKYKLPETMEQLEYEDYSQYGQDAFWVDMDGVLHSFESSVEARQYLAQHTMPLIQEGRTGASNIDSLFLGKQYAMPQGFSMVGGETYYHDEPTLVSGYEYQLKDSGGNVIGGADLNPNDTNFQKSMQGKGPIGPNDPVWRWNGIWIDEAHQGQSLGKALFLETLKRHPGIWIGSTQLGFDGPNSPAVGALGALQSLGLVDVYWIGPKGGVWAARFKEDIDFETLEQSNTGQDAAAWADMVPNFDVGPLLAAIDAILEGHDPWNDPVIELTEDDIIEDEEGGDTKNYALPPLQQKLVDIFGTTDDIYRGAWLLNDGRMLDLVSDDPGLNDEFSYAFHKNHVAIWKAWGDTIQEAMQNLLGGDLSPGQTWDQVAYEALLQSGAIHLRVPNPNAKPGPTTDQNLVNAFGFLDLANMPAHVRVVGKITDAQVDVLDHIDKSHGPLKWIYKQQEGAGLGQLLHAEYGGKNYAMPQARALGRWVAELPNGYSWRHGRYGIVKRDGRGFVTRFADTANIQTEEGNVRNWRAKGLRAERYQDHEKWQEFDVPKRQYALPVAAIGWADELEDGWSDSFDFGKGGVQVVKRDGRLFFRRSDNIQWKTPSGKKVHYKTSRPVEEYEQSKVWEEINLQREEIETTKYKKVHMQPGQPPTTIPVDIAPIKHYKSHGGNVEWHDKLLRSIYQASLVRGMQKEGKTVNQIAQETGLSKPTIQAYLGRKARPTKTAKMQRAVQPIAKNEGESVEAYVRRATVHGMGRSDIADAAGITHGEVKGLQRKILIEGLPNQVMPGVHMKRIATLMEENPDLLQKEIAAQVGLGLSTVKRYIKEYKEYGGLKHYQDVLDHVDRLLNANQLYFDGAQIADIAKAMGMSSTRTIGQYLDIGKRMGLNGFNIADSAAFIREAIIMEKGVSPSVAGQASLVDDQDLQEIRKLYRDGLTGGQIAARMGIAPELIEANAPEQLPQATSPGMAEEDWFEYLDDATVPTDEELEAEERARDKHMWKVQDEATFRDETDYEDPDIKRNYSVPPFYALPDETDIVGRPDLAKIGIEGRHRRFEDLVDEERNKAGMPESVPMAVDEMEARERLDANYMFERNRLLDMADNEQPFNPIEVIMAQIIFRREAAQAFNEGDSEKLVIVAKLRWAWRDVGAVMGRAFHHMRDLVETPEERRQRAILDALSQAHNSMAEWKWLQETLASMGVQLADLMVNEWLAVDILQQLHARNSQWSDRLFEYWRNMILSGPKTHVTNIMSTIIHGGYNMTILRVGEAIVNSFMKNPNYATFGEFKHMIKGIWPGLILAAHNARLAFQHETSILNNQVGAIETNKFDAAQVAIPGKWGKRIRAMGMRPLLFADEFLKAVFAQMEVRAYAYREAQQLVMDGQMAPGEVHQWMHIQAADMQSTAWRKAFQRTLEHVFQEEGGYVAKNIKSLLIRGRDFKYSGIKYVFPFVQTPTNLIIRGTKMSPLGIIMNMFEAWMGEDRYVVIDGDGKMLAHFDTRRAASARARKLGGAEHNVTVVEGRVRKPITEYPQEIAEGIITLGLVLLVLSATDGDDPWITGAEEEGDWRKRTMSRESYQPQSIKFMGKWYSYARIEPFATAIAMVTDFINGVRRGDPIDAAWAGLMGQWTNKSFLQGSGQIVEAFNSRDAGKFEKILGSYAISFAVPNFLRQVGRAKNEYVPERRMWNKPGITHRWKALATNTALKSEFFAQPGYIGVDWEFPRYSIWGEKLPSTRGHTMVTDFLWRLTMPIETRPAEMHPMTHMFMQYIRREPGYNPGMWPKQVTTAFEHQNKRHYLTREEFADYAEVSGKFSALTALSIFTDKQIENPTINDINHMKDILSKQRAAARDALKMGWLAERGEFGPITAPRAKAASQRAVEEGYARRMAHLHKQIRKGKIPVERLKWVTEMFDLEQGERVQELLRAAEEAEK